MKKRRFSLGKRTTLIVFLFALILGGLTILLSMRLYTNATQNLHREIGQNFAMLVRLQLDGDAVEAYAKPGAVIDERYNEIITDLREAEKLNDMVTYIFVFVPTAEGQRYIFDSDDSADRFPLGYMDPWYDEFKSSVSRFMAGESVDPMVSNESFGWLLTCYEPLKNSSGAVVAYVGVDLSMNTIMLDRENYLILLTLLILLVTIGFSVFASLHVRASIVMPIDRMAQAADSFLVEQDSGSATPNFNSLADLDIRTNDEISDLSVSLHAMMEKINNYIGWLDVANKRAEIDALTGLLNHEAFTEKASALLAETSSRHNMNAFLMIDLDDFKNVNTQFGHVAGDRCLRDCAAMLKDHVRSGDIAGRLGGDEMAVLLYGVSSKETVGRKAAEIIAAAEKLGSAEGAVPFALSVGIALSPADGTDLTTLYQRADEALYRVKNTGKHAFHFYDDL